MSQIKILSFLVIKVIILNKFFRNSALNDEARRIVGLIEMARHEAISNGYPMQVWFDLENQRFGMRELSGMGNQSDNPTGGQVQSGRHVYQLNTHLEIELDTSTMVSQAFPSIVYFPDGQLETSSLPGFYLKNKKQVNQRLQIVRSPSWLRYEIRKNDEMLLIQNETL